MLFASTDYKREAYFVSLRATYCLECMCLEEQELSLCHLFLQSIVNSGLDFESSSMPAELHVPCRVGKKSRLQSIPKMFLKYALLYCFLCFVIF